MSSTVMTGAVTTMVSPLTVKAQENDSSTKQSEKETAPDITLPENLQADEGTALQEVQLPENWTWVDESTVASIGTEEYPARLAVDDTAYDYTEVKGYDAAGHYVERMLKVEVNTNASGTGSVEKDLMKKSAPGAPYSNNGDVAIDATNFPDDEFRKYIKYGGFDKNYDRVLSQTEIQNVKELEPAQFYRNTQSVEGIALFPNLEKLDCKNTKITSLDVSKNTNLIELSCTNTPLETLNVSGNGKLKKLYCWGTKLRQLDVSKCPLLEVLSCEDAGSLLMNITELDVSKNTNLIELKCTFAKISELDVSKNKKLTKLECGSIKSLEELDVSENTLLEVLNCTGTNISTLDVSKNTKLRELSCQNTQITTLDVSKNEELTDLACKNTGMTYLDLSNNKKLEYLTCQTPLAYLDFGEKPNLTKLYLIDKPLELKTLEEQFNIQDKYPGITLSKISDIKGADFDPVSGTLSNYKTGGSISYTYDSGTVLGKPYSINVALNIVDPREESELYITENVGKIYDTLPVEPKCSKTGSTGEITYKWEKKISETEWVAIPSAPADAGDYRVTATLAADDNFKGATTFQEFTISKGFSRIRIISLTKTYDGNPVSTVGHITKTGSSKDVTFTWTKQTEDSQWEGISSAPTDVGTYRLKAAVEEDDNYMGTSTTSQLVIRQAEPSYQVPQGLQAVPGQKLSDIVLPKGFTWTDQTLDVGNVGDNTFTVVYTPENPNYKTVTDIPVTITVSSTDNPVIVPGDDTNKPSDGTDTNTNNSTSKLSGTTDKKTGAVKTGDTASTGLWMMLMAAAAGTAGAVVLLKRKKYR